MSSEEVELDADATAELASLQPSYAELRWLNGISVFYFLLALCAGLPLWLWTTTPVQRALPSYEIDILSRHPISVGVNVVIINFDEANLPIEALSQLQTDLYSTAGDTKRRLEVELRQKREQDGSNDISGLPVAVDYRFLLQKITPAMNMANYHRDDSSTFNKFEHDLFKSGLLDRLWDQETGLKVDDAYFFVIMPPSFIGFLGKTEDGMVRNSAERNLIYLRSPCATSSSSGCAASLPTLSVTILDLLQEHLVSPTKLQAVYESVWLESIDMQYMASNKRKQGVADTMDSARFDVAHTRSHQLPPAAGYEIVVSLVSAFQTSVLPPLTDNWLPEGRSFGQWVQAEIFDSGLISLSRYIHLDINSQYIYSVSLDSLQWSRMSKFRTHRFYNTTQLSNLLNELEVHLGQHSRRNHGSNLDESSGTNGLHLVVVVDQPPPSGADNSTHRPLRFKLNDDGEASSIAVIPQWGAFVSLDDVDVRMGNLGRVLVNTIFSLVGVSRHRRSHSHVKLPSPGSRDVLFEQSDDKGLAKWELDAWLRFRTIESLSTTSLTLNSLVNMVQSLPNMVIQDYVAERVHRSARAWGEAIDALILLPSSSPTTTNLLEACFLHSKTALEQADAAFFDHSLLDMLYFPSDQVYGIYLPLFTPILLALLPMVIAAFKFFTTNFKDSKAKRQ